MLKTAVKRSYGHTNIKPLQATTRHEHRAADGDLQTLVIGLSNKNQGVVLDSTVRHWPLLTVPVLVSYRGLQRPTPTPSLTPAYSNTTSSARLSLANMREARHLEWHPPPAYSVVLSVP